MVFRENFRKALFNRFHDGRPFSLGSDFDGFDTDGPKQSPSGWQSKTVRSCTASSVYRTDLFARAKGDRSVFGLKGLSRKEPEKAGEIAGRIIRDTYRVLMTRGLKGCFIYSPDEETRNWFRSRIGRPEAGSDDKNGHR